MNKTLEFFNEICKIPRPSGHEEKISNFLVKFAKDRDLEVFTDKTFNIIIKKKTNIKNCNKTLILQAHQDMVCEKNLGVEINFLTDAIKTKTKGDFLSAQGTTLGADNGIGLSMILSILDDNNLRIPNLECVFTTQEETTMLGAMNLDFSKLKGKHILSIDGTDEGQIEVSSAGMVVFNFEKDFDTQDKKLSPNDTVYKFELTGLSGGHSGTEINTTNQNAIKLMFEFLETLKTPIDIFEVHGGGKSNAIPRECFVACVAHNFDETRLKTLIINFESKYKDVEKDIKLGFCKVEGFAYKSSIGNKNSKKLLDFVGSYQNGVLVWDENKKDFPIVSNNLANINLQEGKLKMVISLRSSVKKLEEEFLAKIRNKCSKYDFKFTIESSAPFFEKKENSYLQEVLTKTYESLFNKKAKVHGVHAGLEGGVFAKKIKDVDICVIAPNIYDCHSPQERVSLSSVDRVYSWLEKIVEEF